MKQNLMVRWFGWTLALLLVAAELLLLFLMPMLGGAVLAVTFLVIVAVFTAKKDGFWSEVRLFIIEILFGW